MRTHQQVTLTFESSDTPSVIPSAELQMVCLSAGMAGYGIWFTTEQIPQIEQLLSLLWAMKDEEQQQLKELAKAWETNGNGHSEGNGYVHLTEF